MSERTLGADPYYAALSGWMQDLAPFGVLTIDTDFRVQGWNQWLEVHSNLKAAEVVGRSILEIFPEIKERKLDLYFQRALAGEVSLLATALHGFLLPLPATVRETGSPHMFQTVRIAPLLSGTSTLGAIVVIEDVSQREHHARILRRQNERDRLLSWALAHLLKSQDPLKDIATLFPRIASQLDLEVHFTYLLDPDGKSLRLLSSGGITAQTEREFATLAVGESLCGGWAVERRPVNVSNLQDVDRENVGIPKKLGLRAYAGFPLLVGDRLLGTLSFASFKRNVIAEDEFELLSTISQYVAIAIDRSLRDRVLGEAQQSLREHAENLETKIVERTARLHETIAQLESFSYTVAHDLRSPIRALKGYCEVLSEDYSLAMPDEGHSVLQRLSRSSDRLDALTRDLLTFSKLSRQDVQLTVVDVAEVVQDILFLTPSLQDDVLVAHPPLGKVWGQRTLLQQCLSNLFDNALKFVRMGQKPRVIIRCEMRDPTNELKSAPIAPFNPATHQNTGGPVIRATSGGATTGGAADTGKRLRIWVEDDGIGIAPELHQKIFGIFERVGGPDTPEGTGIGLAIVARAMQQMGGWCGVESSLGMGSRFWLELRQAT